MSTSPFATVLPDVEPVFDEERAARLTLMCAHLDGSISWAEFEEFGNMLNLFADTTKPRERHLRAVPVDWKRTGAVGIS